MVARPAAAPARATDTPARPDSGHPLRKYLIAGLLTWLPLAITIWVLLWVQGLAAHCLNWEEITPLLFPKMRISILQFVERYSEL